MTELDEIRKRLKTGDYSNYKFHPSATVVGIDWPIENDWVLRAIRNRPQQSNPELDKTIEECFRLIGERVMINIVVVMCDRCGKEIKGLRTQSGTAGFYRRSGWSQYMNDGENVVCDACMWADPRYLEDYPNEVEL